MSSWSFEMDVYRYFIGLGMSGKITTVAELEANLKEMDMSNNNRQQKTMPGAAGHGPSLGVTPGLPPSSLTSVPAVCK